MTVAEHQAIGIQLDTNDHRGRGQTIVNPSSNDKLCLNLPVRLVKLGRGILFSFEFR